MSLQGYDVEVPYQYRQCVVERCQELVEAIFLLRGIELLVQGHELVNFLLVLVPV